MRKINLLLIFISILFFTDCSKTQVTTVEPRNHEWEISPEEQAFLDTLQNDTFEFFWETTNPQNGLTPDRYPDPPFASIAAVGFSLSSYLVGIEDGYISRQQAAERSLNTLEFFWNAPQNPNPNNVTGYKGFFYHFLHMDTGHRFKQTELSTIDTSLLLAGILSSQTYFDKDTPQENRIRALADSIYYRADWTWFYDKEHKPLINMGWRPENGFVNAYWRGYNEAMILYVLALGSPTHAIDSTAWNKWTSTYQWEELYRREHVNFSPLFGHQYSHIWIDFRGIEDEYMQNTGINYFENSRRATYAQRAYAIDNPQDFEEYGPQIWGFTACDGPAPVNRQVNGESVQFHTYWARGVSSGDIRDDGTITPTAAGGSVPFAPEICIPALFEMKQRYGDWVYREYGFLDAFNPSFTFADVEMNRGDMVDPEKGWVNGDYLGIDQGPILLMVENYQTGFLWDLMKKNKYIQKGLKRAGFTGGWLE